MGYPKVTVVGAGFVGATTAQRILEKEIADVVLIDVVEGLPQGKALDMMESAPTEKFRTKIVGTNNYADTANSDVVVITAGLARKPGMTRDDLLFKNAEIVGDIVENIVKHSPNTILIIVTNPLDVMVYLAWKKSGFPANRVIGMAGELDSARMAYFIAEKTGVPAGEVEAIVLGGHGDQMVPVPQHTKVQGKPLPQVLDKDTIEKINQRTRDGGAEIVGLLKTGSAYYAPSASSVRMVRSILQDKKETIASCVLLKGEYGINDIYVGVPVVLGRKGVEKVVELPLTADESKALHVSANHVKENCDKLKL